MSAIMVEKTGKYEKANPDTGLHKTENEPD